MTAAPGKCLGLHGSGSSHPAAVSTSRIGVETQFSSRYHLLMTYSAARKETQVTTPLRARTRAPSLVRPARPSLHATQVPALTSTPVQLGTSRIFATYGYKVASGQTRTAEICPLNLRPFQSSLYSRTSLHRFPRLGL